MFASSHGPRSVARRRGIVLVLVLGMLGLMALIGVTFATFAGQSLKSGRSYSQGLARPQPEALMDYALAQLINDTNNPLSSLRGHSLLRDMYGNDSVFRGSSPPTNAVADTNGLMTTVNTGSGVSTLHFTNVGYRTASGGLDTPFYNQLQYETNIPIGGPYQGYDFTRWIVRFTTQNGSGQTSTVAQTFEILEDDYSGRISNVHYFTLSAALGNPTNDPWFNNAPLSSSDTNSFIYNDPNLGADSSNATAASKNFTALNREYSGGFTSKTGNVSNPFVLDGRFMRAFNGPGLTRPVSSVQSTDANGNSVSNYNYPFNQAAQANMRIAGYDPDAIGMDEDYDACDLENWFLAIQSADGQVMIPSFHRPGILTSLDWTIPAVNSAGTSINNYSRAKILRPRQADNSPLFPTDPSVIDSSTGRLTYDIDNDGDGVTDSVWLDLGYPVQRDPNGRLLKPLFAFMVLGLNGRLPLNTVGNLQARAIGDTTNNAADGVPYPTSSGQIPYPGYYTDSGSHAAGYSSQVFFDQPLFDHASHLGFSVNEINPKFALQNAPSNLYGSSDGVFGPNAQGTYSVVDTTNNRLGYAAYTQNDDAGVSVALTQLRNILAGTMSTDLPNPYPTSSTVKLPVATSAGLPANNDVNVVAVDGKPYILPNNMGDAFDANPYNLNYISRGTTVVPGRWGEPDAIPGKLPFPTGANYDTAYPVLVYNNIARAGRSHYSASGGTIDPMDDDFDGFDPVLATTAEQQPITLYSTTTSGDYQNIPLYPSVAPYTTYPAYAGPSPFTRLYPEEFDKFDNAGQMAVASERIRRFVTPQDTNGIGRLVVFATGDNQVRPSTDNDFGYGSDIRGRVSYFRYFRPAGLPQEVVYPYHDGGTATASNFKNSAYITNSGKGQQYLMPVLLPAGRSQATAALGQVSTPDVTNNRLHGYQSALTPQIQMAGAHYLAAMPYDWDPWLAVNDTNNVGTPPGYNNTPMDINPGAGANPSTKGLMIQLYTPTINPNTPLVLSSINTSYGPNLGSVGDTGNTIFPLPYSAGFDQFKIKDVAGTNVKDSGGTEVTFERALGAPVVNGLFGGSLNKDEADEMNLYSVNPYDMPYGPSDLEWLYRKQDIDGATLTSRLAQLAPVSFLNPADGLTRRRLFSTDSWDLINFSYANDNPVPYAGILGGNGFQFNSRGHSPDHDFTYNSRFMPNASPSLEIMNQVVSVNTNTPQFTQFANPITTEFLPNPTLPTNTGNGDSFGAYVPNSSFSGSPSHALPLLVDNTNPNTVNAPYNMFTNAFNNAQVNQYTNVITPYDTTSAAQVQTPSVAHRDRKINLNYPLPISNDPAEPIRQKWCRETYQMLKAILPPASVDTPEELAALSQFVVNIIDFRDPDCSATRFVNTDLVVTDVLTKRADTSQLRAMFNTTWTVSPAGVAFTPPGTIPAPHFPFDPSLYNPDTTPTCAYLVQHGMEYSPIAINEAMAYASNYAKSSMDAVDKYAAMFVVLVNTLSESQNNPKSSYRATGPNATRHNIPNSSAISLTGWDIVVLPDNYGWGRPDPITGDVNPVVMPVYTPNPTGDPAVAPAAADWVNAATTDDNWKRLQAAVAQFTIPENNPSASPAVNAYVKAMSGTGVDKYIIGDYRTNYTTANPMSVDDPTTLESDKPVAKKADIDVRLPVSFPIPVAPDTQGMYYWVYLRRPANPFDTDLPNKVRPNKEMVVVDSMRFPVINATDATFTASLNPNQRPTNIVKAANAIYSAQRLQPYRGGHLVAQNTNPMIPAPTTNPPRLITDLPTTAVASAQANGVTSICPPSPPYAYGYSEQMAEPPDGEGYGAIKIPAVKAGDDPTYVQLSQKIQQSINNTDNSIKSDTNWAHLPFHDRDFNNVAELLLVPGCPPGLFTKQFVEEPYPGNIFANAAMTTTAVGTDNGTRAFAYTTQPKSGTQSDPAQVPGTSVDSGNSVIVAPDKDYDPSQVGRQDFNVTKPSYPTFPYLTDNFYYTAASVSPPVGATALDADYNYLTTEIGGWTGAGWHKMMEFFEVPSSANGAVGTADAGDNYDWYRADVKPGLLNLNLIIDEEVFAGLMDDPRLNENLAALSNGTYATTIPYLVNQIDSTGFPTYTVDSTTSLVTFTGQTPMFQTGSFNDDNGVAPLFIPEAGRGYVTRDPNALHYANLPPTGPFQQVHGMKAAFSDFIKLLHGGSGYLFAHGGGDVGMGTFQASGVTAPIVTNPIAADRPYRSLSYPDINYTIMRPASLPPAPTDTTPTYSSYISPGTVPPLPYGLGDMFSYNANAFPASGPPFVQLLIGNVLGTIADVTDNTTNTPLAPMNAAMSAGGANYQYVQDPGIKNPFLAIQYAHRGAATSNVAATRRWAPPYEATYGPNSTPHAEPIAAPFPPPIPPTPARRLFQIPDASLLSNASYTGGYNAGAYTVDNSKGFPVNVPVSTPALSNGPNAGLPTAPPTPPSLVTGTRLAFGADNFTPIPTPPDNLNNFLGAGPFTATTVANDYRQHPVYRTEMIQKISNLTTVRTHQFATWITIGFFEVVRTGTPELGIPDTLGAEIGSGAGDRVRYRAFFVIDRTKATGFNPYYPGNFRDCVTYRRRIE